MTIQNTSISRFRRTAFRRTSAVLLIAGTIVASCLAQPPAEPRQTSFIELPGGTNANDAPQAEVARLYGVGGYWAFVRQAGGDIGIVAGGGRASEVLHALAAHDSFSALEIYQALGGDRHSAPEALVSDHQKHEGERPPRSTELPALSSLNAGVTPAAILGQSALGLLGGASCVKGAMPTFDYFKWSFWQGGVLNIPGTGQLQNIGAHGQKGIGTWNQGSADLVLGSTSAGAAAVCFPQDESNARDARITVQEYYSNGIWVDLWSTSQVYDGAAYGYWFKGSIVHKIRVLIRDTRPLNAQNPPIGPFYWAAAY